MRPILLLERARQHITTVLVTDLPELDGKTAIAIFVDCLTKITHIVPCTKEVTICSVVLTAHTSFNQIFCFSCVYTCTLRLGDSAAK